MVKNPITFIIDSNGDYLRYGGTIRAINGYREFIRVLTPQALTDKVSVSMMSNNAKYNQFEQYVIPTAKKGVDVLDSDDALYETCADWNVFEVEIKGTALVDFSQFRSGSVTFSFQFQQVNASSKCVSYEGVFGVDSPLPTTSQTEGDYYACEDNSFTLVSGTHTYVFSQDMLVYWNGTRWVKDRLLVSLNTSTVNIPVEPSHAVGYELDDDEVNYLESIGGQVAQNTIDIATNETDIADIIGGEKAFDEFLMSDGTSVQPNLNANQDGDIMVRDTDGNYKNSQRLVDAEDELVRLENDKADITYVDAQDTILDNKITANEDAIALIELDIIDLEDANMFKTITINPTTYVLTFTRYDDTTETIDLPIEQLIVSGAYDEVNKDLVLTLDNGSTIVIPVDDIFDGLATQEWVNTQLESYYTQMQLDTKFNAKVDRNISGYTVLLSANSDGNEDLYIYDGGIAKRISLDEVAAYTNAAAGAFQSSATYTDLTSGASIMVLIHNAQLDTDGDYKVDLKTITRDKLVFIKFPSVTATDDLRFSTDDGTTYYNVTKNGSTFKASLVSGQLVRLEFDGTQFIADIQGDVEIEETYTDRIESTYGQFNPLDKGLPLIKEIQGRTIPALENLVVGENIANLGTVTYSTVNGDKYYDTYTGTVTTGTGSDVTITNESGATLDITVIHLNAHFSVSTQTLIDNAVSDIEAQLEANGGYIDTTDTTHVENSEFKATGKNLFDISQGMNELVTQATYEQLNDNEFKLTHISGFASVDLFPYISYFENTQYTFSGQIREIEDSKNLRLTINYTDGTFDTIATPNTIYTSFTFTSANGKTIDNIAYGFSNTLGITYYKDFMIEQGTVATTYVPYNSETQLFNHGALRSTIDKTVYDKIRYENGAYVKDVYIDESDNTALETPLLANEVIDVDGTLIQESVTSVEQKQNIPTTYKLEYSMNTEQTTKTLVERDKLQQLEIDNLEDSVETLTARKTTTNDIIIMSETAWATYEQVDGEVYGVYDESTFVITFYYGQAT